MHDTGRIHAAQPAASMPSPHLPGDALPGNTSSEGSSSGVSSPGAASLNATIRKVPLGAPLGWVRQGAADLRATGARGLAYGIVFAAMGLALEHIYATHWQLTMALTAGFFLTGPFVLSGLYELSRQRELGQPPSLPASAICWRAHSSAFGFFAVLLPILMVFWARTSVVVFALFSTSGLPSVQDVLSQIFSTDNLEFLIVWTLVGLVFAAAAFSISVVSVPMMLDRRTDAITAMFNSVRALYANPAAMLVWAALIVALIGASLALAFVPLAITAPLIGHATWHAYRDLVE